MPLPVLGSTKMMSINFSNISFWNSQTSLGIDKLFTAEFAPTLQQRLVLTSPTQSLSIQKSMDYVSFTLNYRSTHRYFPKIPENFSPVNDGPGFGRRKSAKRCWRPLHLGGLGHTSGSSNGQRACRSTLFNAFSFINSVLPFLDDASHYLARLLHPPLCWELCSKGVGSLATSKPSSVPLSTLLPHLEVRAVHGPVQVGFFSLKKMHSHSKSVYKKAPFRVIVHRMSQSVGFGRNCRSIVSLTTSSQI